MQTEFYKTWNCINNFEHLFTTHEYFFSKIKYIFVIVAMKPILTNYVIV